MSFNFAKYLEEAYVSVGALDFDVIYLYTDFRTFGTHVSAFPSRAAFMQAVIEPFLERGRTVITPTFTYTTEGDFQIRTTPTFLGAFNKWILQQPDHVRSEHPLFSFAALGPRAEEFMRDVGKSAFGWDSVHDRLHGQKVGFLHVGRPIELGNTALHYVEQRCGASYRIHKAFSTRVLRGEQYVGTDYTAFLRRRDVEGQNFAFTFREAAALLKKQGWVREFGSVAEFTNISCYPFDQTLSFLSSLFYEDQTIFIETNFIQR